MRIEITDLGYERISISSADHIEEVAFGRLPNDEELEAIRWYLEDFKALPFGGDNARALAVEGQLAELGRNLFQPILESSWIRQVIETDLKNGTSQLEFVIRSDNSDFLSLPWELAYSDASDCFLAKTGVAFSRENLSVSQLDGKPRQPGPIRILLIIARPKRLGAVPVDTIAYALMQIAEASSSQVEVDVLRPPTIKSLRSRITEHEYDIVHFDGHGEFVGLTNSEGSEGSKGYLLFETADAHVEPVSAHDLARMMPRGHLPLFVLNACKSARAGREQPMSSVSAQLLGCGGPGVVAMSYSVRVDAVEVFMGAFYQALISGSGLARAVAQGRRELLHNRAQQNGLQDWFIPVLYSFQDCAWLDSSKVERSVRNMQPPAQGWARLFGRGNELIEVERRFASESTIMIVRGVIGSAKTEFCRGFAEWFQASGGVKDTIVIDAYECQSVSEAVQQTIWAVTGQRRTPDGDPVDALLGLKPSPVLVVWDHAEQLLHDSVESSVLQQLQHKFAAARWKVLLTTCGFVPANCPYAQVELHDLTNEEAWRRLSEKLDREALDSNSPLIHRLFLAADYYPRELDRLISAMTTDEALQAIEVMQWGTLTDAEWSSDPRIGEAFDKLTDRAQQILPLTGLFGGQVNPGFLTIFTNGDLKHDVYAEWFDSSVAPEEWSTLLTEAASVGLASGPLLAGIFQIPPLVRTFFRQALNDSHGESGLESLTVGVVELYSALSVLWMQGDQVFNEVVVVSEEQSLLRAIYSAVRRKMFREARIMVDTVVTAWERNGIGSNVPLFVLGVRDLAGPEFPRDEDELLLWAELASCNARFAQLQGDNQLQAEVDHEIIQRLNASNGKQFLNYVAQSEIRLAEAACTHGDAVEARHHLDRAEQLATRLDFEGLRMRCAEIRMVLARQRAGSETLEVLNSEGAAVEPSPDAALHHERLGKAAMAKEDHASAHDHFAAAFRTWLLIGRERESINARSMLADALEKLGHIQEALRIYKEVVYDQYRTEQHGRAANTALLIGQVLEQLGEFREAKKWCESAIPVLRHLKMKMGIGHAFHELAIISLTAPENADPTEAIGYLQQAIDVYGKIGSPHHAASSLLLLAQVHLQADSLEDARTALRRSRSLADRIGSREVEGERDLLLAKTELMLGSPEDAIEPLVAFSRRQFVNPQPPESDQFLELLMDTRNMLGKDRFEMEWDTAGGSKQLIVDIN